MREGKGGTRRLGVLEGILVCGLLGFSSGWAFSSQEPGSRAEDFVVSLRADLVSFVVSVTGGRRARELTREDFRVYEDGVRQQIAHFATMEAPIDIVLMVDTSGSMHGEREMIERALIRFLERVRVQDRVAVVEFHREAILRSDFTAQKGAVREATSHLGMGSATAFYDALGAVADRLLGSRSERTALVIFTDGVDSASVTEFAEACERVERSGSVVYVIAPDTESFMIAGVRRGTFALSAAQLERYRRAYRPEDLPTRYRQMLAFTEEERVRIVRGLYRMARRQLRQLAERTGGRVFWLKDLADLDEAYAAIQAELGTLYSLGYYSGRSAQDGAWHSLRVEVTVAGARVRARSGYWAPRR